MCYNDGSINLEVFYAIDSQVKNSFCNDNGQYSGDGGRNQA